MKKTLAEELRSYATVLTEAKGVAHGSPEEVMQAFEQLKRATSRYLSEINSFSALYDAGSVSLDLSDFLDEWLSDIEADMEWAINEASTDQAKSTPIRVFFDAEQGSTKVEDVYNTTVNNMRGKRLTALMVSKIKKDIARDYGYDAGKITITSAEILDN